MTSTTLWASDAAIDTIVSFDIPQQRADLSLTEFAQQANQTLVFPFDVANAKTANRLVGKYPIGEGLKRLLAGTGLRITMGDQGELTVVGNLSRTGESTMEMSKPKQPFINRVVAAMAAMVVGGQVLAEDAGTATETATLEEITITAERTTSTVGDTPLAISAFTDAMLEDRTIRDGNDLQFYVPGMTFGATATVGEAQITIRGIGTETLAAGGDPGVAVNVDGVYRQASGVLNSEFFDVERVEVLRGPQGTLYGRNATGGAINVINKRPTEVFSVDSRLTTGNYDDRKLETAVSGPLIGETLLGRLSLSTEQRDGYERNVAPNPPPEEDSDNLNYWAGRWELEYRPTDDLDALLIGYVGRDDGKGPPTIVNEPYSLQPTFLGFDLSTGAPVLVFGNLYAIGNAGPNPSMKNIRTYTSNVPNRQKINDQGATLEINWNFSNMKLTAISGYYKSHVADTQDTDGSDAVAVSVSPYDLRYRSFSQELRLASIDATAFDWVVGLYYYTARDEFTLDLFTDALASTPALPANVFIIDPGSVDTESYAAFAQATWHISDRFGVTVGGRYTDDSKKSDEGLYSPGFLIFNPVTGGALRLKQDESWNKPTGKLGVDYRYSDDALLYASVSSGYKSGGMNVGALGMPFDPEEVIAYEAGLKRTLLNQRLQLNLAGFYYDYQDLQVFQIEDVLPAVTNAAKATSQGVELELVVVPTENLQLNASVGWLDATFNSFDTADPVAPQLGVQALSGNHLSRSPEWKYNLGGAYSWKLGRLGSISARVDYSWLAKQYYRVYNLKRDEQPAYHVTNARVWWESGDARWRVDVWGANLENDDALANMVVAASTLGNTPVVNLMPPRTYGLTLGYHL